MKKLLAVILLITGLTANAQGSWNTAGGSAIAKSEYRSKALKGLIKGKLSSSASLIEDENGLHRFTDGETVTKLATQRQVTTIIMLCIRIER